MFVIFYFTTVGTTPMKSLKTAMVQGDEDRALNVYMTVNGSSGKLLIDEIVPSDPFPSNKKDKHEFETPIHLASKMAMKKIIERFLQQGGNCVC